MRAGAMGSELGPTAPAELLRNIARGFGDERANEWASRLPRLVQAAAEQWELDVGRPFAGLSFNWVAPCRRRDGTEAVLKIGPWLEDLAHEAAALRAYDGRGCVRLLADDAGPGILLLERIRPGEMLTSQQDEACAIGAAAEVLGAIRTAPPEGHAFPSVADWADSLRKLRERYRGGGGPMDPHVFERAEATYRELLAAPTGEVLLHGDLHHYNILSGPGGWCAIDPKGVTGEPEYECGALLRNPLGIIERRDAARVLHRRGLQLADALGYDRHRVLAWAGAQLVLSVTWTVLDEEDSQALRWLPLAGALFEAAGRYP